MQFTNLHHSQIQLKHVCNVQIPAIHDSTDDTSGTSVKKTVFEDIQSVESYKPFIIAFKLSQQEIDSITLFVKHTKAYSFNQIMTSRGKIEKASKGRKLNITEILNEVWPRSREFWFSLCHDLQSGDLPFSDFEEYFYNEESNRAEQLANELVNFMKENEDIDWITSRLDQFHNFKMVYNCLEGATVIMNIVVKYGMTGDFSHISQIIGIVSLFFLKYQLNK